MAHDVFISHSKKDKSTAIAVCVALEAKGIKCWIAPRNILGGSKWSGEIIRAITKSKVMVLVFSSNANNSLNVEREVERAVNKEVPIIPFGIEDVAPSENLEYYLSMAHWLEATTPPEEHHFQQLIDSVKNLLEMKGVKNKLKRMIVDAKGKSRSVLPPSSRQPAADYSAEKISSDFIGEVAREVEAVMQREMYTPLGGPTFMPPLYRIYLSNDDNSAWQGDKRLVLELGLFYILSEAAKRLSSKKQLAAKSFAVELRVEGTLNKGEFRVEPMWEDPSSKIRRS